MAWEWHERERDTDGRFTSSQKAKMQCNIKINREVGEELRRRVIMAKMQVGDYVEQALKAYWEMDSQGKDAE